MSCSILTVSPRELHALLEVGRVFGAWITSRIEKYNFVENKDFIIVSQMGINSGAGRPSLEYHISTDMAKELSMVENNEMGGVYELPV